MKKSPSVFKNETLSPLYLKAKYMRSPAGDDVCDEKIHDKKAELKRLKKILLISFLLTLLFSAAMCASAYAAEMSFSVETDNTDGNLGALELIFLFAFLALLPAVVVMMTSFTRVVIVLSFTRNAVGTQQAPPNMVITGIAIFITILIMRQPLINMYNDAYMPFSDGEITSTQALEAAGYHAKVFMLEQMTDKSLSTFVELAQGDIPEVADPDMPVELPLTIIVPAFITSELTKAFKMGFYIFLPFLVVDMVVASILMSMGMVMLPPAMIALPFKILLFVMVDGWNVLITTIVDSFR